MKKMKISPEWFSLPYDLLAMIAKQLQPCDRLRFRSVCHSFRSSIPPPSRVFSPHLPLKIPYPTGQSDGFDDHLLLTESTQYAIEHLNKEAREMMKTLLLRVVKFHPDKLRAYETLCTHPYRRNYLLEQLPMSLNLLDFEIKEISKAYEVLTHGTHASAKEFVKFVVSTCLDDMDESFTAMAIYDYHKVIVWRNGDKDWSHVDARFDGIEFEDISYHNNEFYVVDGKGERFAVTVNSKSFYIVKFASHRLSKSYIVDSDYYGEGHYLSTVQLVKSLKELLLFDIISVETTIGSGIERIEALRVFKMDETKNKWVLVMDEDLKDEALIVGEYCSFSISPNCVSCETKDEEPDKELFPPNSNCVYHERKDFVSQILELKDGIGHHWLGETCAYDQSAVLDKIFRSPPTWLNATRLSD